VKVIGHRGGRHFGGNTLQDIQKCASLNIDVEVDVQPTKDNEIILFHDKHIKNHRVKKEVASLTYEKILRIDGKVPLLGDALTHGKNIHWYIELKKSKQWNHTTIKKFLDIVHPYRQNVVIMSFDINLIKKIWREAGNSFPYGIVCKPTNSSVSKITKAVSSGLFTYLVIHWKALYYHPISVFRNCHWNILAWTVNTPLTINILKKKGIHAIITDYPEEMLRLISNKKQ